MTLALVLALRCRDIRQAQPSIGLLRCAVMSAFRQVIE